MAFRYHKDLTNADLHIPKSHTHPGSELTFPSSSKTDDYTITLSDVIIIGDATSKKITFTLPSASSAENKVFHIKKIDSSDNSVIIDGNGSETIDNYTSIELTGQNDCITVCSDGTHWWII